MPSSKRDGFLGSEWTGRTLSLISLLTQAPVLFLFSCLTVTRTRTDSKRLVRVHSHTDNIHTCTGTSNPLSSSSTIRSIVSSSTSDPRALVVVIVSSFTRREGKFFVFSPKKSTLRQENTPRSEEEALLLSVTHFFHPLVSHLWKKRECDPSKTL